MTTMTEIQQLLDHHTRWLRDKTILRQIDHTDWFQITTPYLDRHNDYLQIYVQKKDSTYTITDDGYIIDDLTNSGCSLDSPRRQELLNITLAGFGVHREGDQLIIRANAESFPQKKHNLIQAMLSVNDLFYLASPHIFSLFYEDVAQWFDVSDIRYTSKVKFTGKSGYDHMFDFVIPRSRQQPERIVQAINNPKKDTAEAIVFKWLDTRETRSSATRLYAFLNNDSTPVSPAVLDALRSYELEPVLWSEREMMRATLAT